MSGHLVSVVLPVFNRQDTGCRALATAQAQVGVDMEIVVVDDGSSQSFELDERASRPHHVRIVRHDRNRGASAARNTGVRAAAGKWIALLDSDDAWLPEKLAEQVSHAQSRSDPSPLNCIVTGFRQINQATGVAVDRLPIASSSAADFAGGCWFAPGTTALIDRRAFDVVGPMDETLLRLEDFDWFLRLALAGGGVETVPRVLAKVYAGDAAPVPRVDRSAALLRQKWLDAHRPQLTAEAGRNLSAYLALEQAKSRWRSGQLLSFAAKMAETLLLRPRLQLPLRRWWNETPVSPQVLPVHVRSI